MELIPLKGRHDMREKNKYWVFKIRKRPLSVWILRLGWVFWLVFWGEVALGSKAELEPKAFVISLSVFLISLFIGLVLWLAGRRRFKKQNR
jgi:hypothetical protein